MKDEKVKRWVLEGSDYVYPRTTNKMLEAHLKQNRLYAVRSRRLADPRRRSQGKKTAVVSTINGRRLPSSFPRSVALPAPCGSHWSR
jgi:urea transport system substrate-binding protein